jgi:hypothetical protein
MKKRMMARSLVAVAVGCVTVVVAAPGAIAKPSAGSALNYSAGAYGTFAFVGSNVKSGKTSPLATGCGTGAGTHRSLSVASVNGAPLFTAGAVHTSLTTTASSSSASSDITTAQLLGGVIGTGDIRAVSTTTRSGSANTYSTTGSQLLGVAVNGAPVADNPAPNTTIPLPGIGKVVLNEQLQRANSLTLNMVHVYVTVAQAPFPTGTQIVLGHAVSGLSPRTTAILSGGAFAAHVIAGTLLTAGPEWPETVCGSTGGQTETNGGASLSLTGVLDTGAAADSVSASGAVGSASGQSSSTVQNAALLGGLVKADTVKAVANVSQNGALVTADDQGSSFTNLFVNGQSIPGNVPANTHIAVGNITVWLHRVLHKANGVDVRMIEITVAGSNPFSLPVGSDIIVARANMAVFPAG